MKNVFGKIVPSIMAWIAVIIALGLGPSIVTANSEVTTNVSGATNSTYMIGMTAIDDFGGFLIILSLLFGGGILALTAGRTQSTNIGDVVSIIGSAILALVGLKIMSGTAIGYIDSMVTAGTGFEKTAYGIFAIILYIAVIGAAGGISAYKAYRKRRSARRSRAMYA